MRKSTSSAPQRRISYLSRMFCRRMSPVDKDMISYFLTSLADRVPLPAPGFPNMTILSTFPSLPCFPDSSLAGVALRNRLREGMAEGVVLLTLKTAEPQCLGDHCRGDISMGEEKREGETVGEMSQQCRANIYGGALMGLGNRVRLRPRRFPPNSEMLCRQIS